MNNDLYEIVVAIEKKRTEYQKYRGSGFDDNGNCTWMKDDVESYSEGVDMAINVIKKYAQELYLSGKD